MNNYFSMEAFDYDDIQLVPNKAIVKSRKECVTSVKFGNRTFKIPVVPANMESVIDEKLAVWLAKMAITMLCTASSPKSGLTSSR